MNKISYKSVYFYLLAKYLDDRISGKRIVSLKIGKNRALLDVRKEKYLFNFGDFIGVFPVGVDFFQCEEFKTINLVDDFDIDIVKQLYFDRIMKFVLLKKDGVKIRKRALNLLFTGRLSVIITDDRNRIIYSNDLRFPMGEDFSFKKKLPIYENLSLGTKYCGSNLHELLVNIGNDNKTLGSICVKSFDDLNELLKNNEWTCVKEAGIDKSFSDFMDEFRLLIRYDEKERCKNELIKYLNKLLLRKKKILSNLNKIIDFDESQYIKIGKAIMYNKNMLRRGMDTVELPFYDEKGVAMLKIDLKKNLSPEQNADSYFRKAEKIKNKRKKCSN